LSEICVIYAWKDHQALTLSHRPDKLVRSYTVQPGTISGSRRLFSKEAGMDTGQWIVIGLSAVFLLWFLVGSTTNRQRADQIINWMQRGTKQIGRISSATRKKGPAVQLGIRDAVAPFRRMLFSFQLEPRENPPLWIYRRLRGWRDELIIDADLRSAPQEEFLFVMGQIVVPSSSSHTTKFLEKYTGAIRRISIQRTSPHLMIHLQLTRVLAISPADFIEDLHGLV
jgi:hypothetical protein